MSELRSDEIGNAIRARLHQVMPEITVYKVPQTLPEYPHFFVQQIEGTDEEDRKNHHFLTFFFDIRYRIASDPSTDLRAEQKLDEMALRLMAALDIIDCNGVKIRCGNKRYEKVDGVLHFFCEIKIQALLVNLGGETAKQNKISVEVKNG